MVMFMESVVCALPFRLLLNCVMIELVVGFGLVGLVYDLSANWTCLCMCIQLDQLDAALIGFRI